MSGASFILALALWAQGLVIFAVAVVLYQRRVPRIVRREIDIKSIALDGAGWPEDARRASNAYINQFELPVLFFVAGAGALWLGATWLEAALCWAFVISRSVHAFIHVTYNNVLYRFFAFCAGVFLIVALWAILGVRLVMMGLA